MDVASAEGMVDFSSDLIVLLGFLFVAHAFELFNGGLLFHILFTKMKPLGPLEEQSEEFHALVGAVSFVVLGVGNMITTLQTVREKHMKSRRTRAVLQRRNTEATPIGTPNTMGPL